MTAIALIAATFLSYGIASLVAVPALVPIFNTLPALPFLYASLRDGRTPRGVLLMLIWAATLGVAATALSYADPVRSARLFIHADAYRHEMFYWVQTGIGAESQPSQFLPWHALHAALFCGLSLVSGSMLSMPMGAVLMNYMGHYVGALAAAARHPLAVAAGAWVPWAVIRVASYVTLGVVLAGPMLSRVGGFHFDIRSHRGWLVLGVAGLLADVLLKATLAPHWPPMLRSLVGW